MVIGGRALNDIEDQVVEVQLGQVIWTVVNQAVVVGVPLTWWCSRQRHNYSGSIGVSSLSTCPT